MNPQLLKLGEHLGDEVDRALVGVEVARVLEAVVAELDGEKLDEAVLSEVCAEEADGEIDPDEVAPHDVEPGDGGELGEVEDGLGSDGGGVAVADVHLPQTEPAQLVLDQVRETVVAQLLLREGF